MYSFIERDCRMGALVSLGQPGIFTRLGGVVTHSCSVENLLRTAAETLDTMSSNSGPPLAAKRWACAFCRNHSFSNATIVLPLVIFNLN